MKRKRLRTCENCFFAYKIMNKKLPLRQWSLKDMPRSDVTSFKRKVLYLLVFATLMGLWLGATLTLERSIRVESGKNGTASIEDENYRKTNIVVNLATVCLTISFIAFMLVQVSWYRYSLSSYSLLTTFNKRSFCEKLVQLNRDIEIDVEKDNRRCSYLSIISSLRLLSAF